MMFRFAIVLSVICASLSHARETDSRVLGVGLATIDLLIQVSDDFLAEHIKSGKGSSCGSSAFMIQKVLSDHGKEAKVVSGGSAANTVRALAQLGEKCAFYSRVGSDDYGRKFCRDLAKIGVEERIAKIENVPTSQVLCMISPEGQRTFIACDPILDDSAPKKEDFEGIQWLHMEARQFNCEEMAMKILQMAHSLHINVSLDLSGCDVIQRHRAALHRAIPQYVDIVFCNEDEIVEFTGLPPMEGALKLQELCPVAVVTLGGAGCIVGYENKAVHVPGLPARVVDTTGAGDFFSAGFLYGVLHGKSMEVSAQIGHRLGSAIVEVIGAELPESSWGVVRDAVGKYL